MEYSFMGRFITGLLVMKQDAGLSTLGKVSTGLLNLYSLKDVQGTVA
jgi:hypothetical protein